MRLPFPTTLRNRGKARTKDARILNGMVDKRRAVVKRPSLNATFAPVEVGPGLGLFVLTTPNHVDDEVIAISNDVLTFGPTVTPFRLRFSVQPSDSNINTAGSPSVTVQVLDRFGSVITTSSLTVTLSLSTNPTSSTLGGTTSKNATNGVATFTDLTMSRSGEGFRITASGPTGTRSATSNAFDVPTVLTFTTQPSSVEPDELFSVVVAAKDSAGNTDTNYGGEINIAIYSATGSGLLSGLTTRLATNGVATFSGLSIDEDGTYTLIAAGTADPIPTAYKPSNRVSNSFTLGSQSFTVSSVGFDGGFGFYSEAPGPFGAISPSSINGSSWNAVFNEVPTSSGFRIYIDGLHDSTFFGSVSSVFGVRYTSSASYNQVGGVTRWIWSGVYWGDSIGNLTIIIR